MKSLVIVFSENNSSLKSELERQGYYANRMVFADRQGGELTNANVDIKHTYTNGVRQFDLMYYNKSRGGTCFFGLAGRYDRVIIMCDMGDSELVGILPSFYFYLKNENDNVSVIGSFPHVFEGSLRIRAAMVLFNRLLSLGVKVQVNRVDALSLRVDAVTAMKFSIKMVCEKMLEKIIFDTERNAVKNFH